MIREHNNRHVLEAKLRGVPASPAADHLAIGHRQAIAMVLARPEHEHAVAQALSSSAELSVRFSAPGEWLVVSEADTPEGLSRRLDVLCGGGAFVVDQSEARVLFRLSGPSVRLILAKGIGLDLDAAAFPAGASANALCGRIGVNLARTAEDVFELIVTRSFADGLFDDLMGMGLEFGMTAAFTP